MLFAVVAWLLFIEDKPELALQRFGGKIAVLVVLFTAALWCGKKYNALM